MNSIKIHDLPQTEKWNCITHATGVVFGIFFIPGMITDTYRLNNTIQLLYISFYCIAFICTFTFSTVYHSLINAQRKNIFRRIDQACIYFLIAATYMPFVYKYMNTAKGTLLLILVWAFVPAGVISMKFYKSKYSFLMVAVYTIQGLMFVIFYNSFFASMPLAIKQMILAGVIFIITGTIFFLWHKWKYHHSIWHLFILCGNMLLFFAIQKSIGG
jgi:hemolysin III